jgi:putative membrane-bound dehydrogenase-like protein
MIPTMNYWPRLLLCTALFAGLSSVHAQVPPEKAVSTFKTSEGLDLSLWASEPLFVNPTCMDVDHKGRAWVCESVNYRCKMHRRPLVNREGDRIVILEDTKGVGKADKATVFYQDPELYAPLGIAVAKDPVGPGYKVYVCQSPDILVFEDKEGKGKADGPPKKLLTGFGGFDHDHGVHGILIGPDNRLYFTVGDTGVHGLKGVDGKKVWNSNDTSVRAGTIWRCDLDGKHLELIAHNFRNEYEACVDSYGTVFVSDNDDDGNQQTRICYVMPGGNYGYHPRGPGQTHWHEEQPGVVPKVLRTFFGSPTGICFYEGNLLPKKYWGQLLHTDAGPRHLRCYHLKPSGASYEIDREDMVNSTDTWFRPSDVCVAPDGSVMVADWYDPGVGGHAVGDTTRGRIYRITPKGHQGYKIPEVDLEKPEGIRAALGSPALSVRAMAMARLAEMKKIEALDVLRPAYEQRENPWLRARALWQVARTQGKNGGVGAYDFHELVSEEKDENLRLLGMRILHDMYSLWPIVDYQLKKLTPVVAREALLLLRDADPGKARKVICQLAREYDGKDRFFLCAVGIAVGQDPERRKIILADFEKEFPDWNERTAGLVWELRPGGMIPRLGEHLLNAKIPPAERVQIVDILASADKNAGPAFLKALQGELPVEVREKILDNLKRSLPDKWRDLRQSAELTGVIQSLLAKPEGQVTALQLIAAAEQLDALPAVLKLAGDARAPAAVRKAAFQTLAHLPAADSARNLVELLKTEPASLRIDVVQALGKLVQQPGQNPAAAPALTALQNLVRENKNELPLRLEAVGGLTGSRAGSEFLLALHAKGDLAEELKPEVARFLRNSPHNDLRTKAMAAFPPPGRLDPKKLPPISGLVNRRGDVQRGKQLFAASFKGDMQCMKCHTVRGSGGQIGPDLSMVGKKASRENLFESILYPSKAIADQYLTWIIETTKGQTLSGLLVEETPEAVTLRDGNGKDTKIPIKEIESRAKGAKSLMPDDLLVYMTVDELVDMVEYLFTLKTPMLSMDYYYIVGPFDNGGDDQGLDQAFGPEKVVNLAESYAGKDGKKVGWRKVRPDAKGYVDLQAFYAPNSAQIVSYLYREIESPADQEATILLGVDDGCKLWLNDKLVHTDRRHIAAVPEADSVRVNLQKGKNRLLFKINNGDGPHGFYLTLVTELELKRLDTK